MSMQVDLINPELGYFDEGLNLTDAALYATARLPFGQATTLPPVAYRSRIFRELESEKVWTRVWTAIGLEQQIPHSGDLLPITLGMHGIHAQRQSDGSIAVRMNRHQHGGCRFVPMQCRSGQQTKCSITSCNYTRDSDVIFADGNGGNTDLMYKFMGMTPERLTPIKFDTCGAFIFANLDPQSGPLHTDHASPLSGIRIDHSESMSLVGKKWLDLKCNWKIAGSLIATYLKSGARRRDQNDHAVQCDAPSLCESNAHFAWFLPNLLISAGQDHVAVVVLQASGVGSTIARCFLLARVSDTATPDFDTWFSSLGNIASEGEQLQMERALHGTSARKGTSNSELPIERDCHAHQLNQFLADRLQRSHEYFRTAPIMDAAMLLRRN
jgi:hypothetical protein